MDDVAKNTIGRKYNDYTVLSFSHHKVRSNGGRLRFYVCRCDCGYERTISQVNLWKSRHCSPNKRTYNVSHKSGHPLYAVWSAMLTRCYNEKSKFYEYYGGRGIEVCHQWINSFENFVRDMGDKPSKEHSLDRINPDGDYEPSNCRWATKKEQANNRRISHLLTMSNVAKRVGCSREYVRQITYPFLASYIDGYYNPRTPIFNQSVVPFLKEIDASSKSQMDRLTQNP